MPQLWCTEPYHCGALRTTFYKVSKRPDGPNLTSGFGAGAQGGPVQVPGLASLRWHHWGHRWSPQQRSTVQGPPANVGGPEVTK